MKRAKRRFRETMIHLNFADLDIQELLAFHPLLDEKKAHDLVLYVFVEI